MHYITDSRERRISWGVATRRCNSSGNLSEMGHYELKTLSSSTGQRCLEEGLARKRGLADPIVNRGRQKSRARVREHGACSDPWQFRRGAKRGGGRKNASAKRRVAR